MPWQVYNFVLLPLMGGLVIGLWVTRAQFAVFAALGLLVAFILVARVSPVDLRQIYPFLTGGIVASLAVGIALLLRPGTRRVWRAFTGVAAAAAAHWTYLAYALETR